jgi:heterodisulfide reductase subunit C
MEPVANVSQLALEVHGSQFEEEVAAQVGPLDLAYCFQCGTCSGSCPTVDRMEYGPRRIMQMIRLGLADTVLRSNDIWLCVSCYSCSARCPQGIKVVDVMSVLRNLSLSKGLAKDKEAAFTRVFMGIVSRYGRMYEPELLVRYYALGGDLIGLLKQTDLALNMLRKGKIALRPERVDSVGEIAEIWRHVTGNGGSQG